MNNSRHAHYATLLGYGGLILWSLSALFTTKLHRIPTLEILTVALGTSFIMAAVKLTLYRQWARIKQPWFIWVIGIIGIYGNDLTFVAAFKYAPPAQADLINYLWPILVILGTALLPKERLTPRYCVAGLFGLLGVYILITQGEGVQGFNFLYIKGYLLALLDAVIWAAYTLLSRFYGKTPLEMVGMYCGVGALLSFVGHLQLETTIVPSVNELFIMFAMGLSTSGMAYYLWDLGVKRGNFKLLSILSYGNPILSIFLLVLFQEAKLSWSLSLACFFVVLGAIIGSINWQQLKFKMCFKIVEVKALLN